MSEDKPIPSYTPEERAQFWHNNSASLAADLIQERQACNEYRNEANAKGTLLADIVADWDKSRSWQCVHEDLIAEARRLISGGARP